LKDAVMEQRAYRRGPVPESGCLAGYEEDFSFTRGFNNGGKVLEIKLLLQTIRK